MMPKTRFIELPERSEAGILTTDKIMLSKGIFQVDNLLVILVVLRVNPLSTLYREDKGDMASDACETKIRVARTLFNDGDLSLASLSIMINFIQISWSG